MSILDPSNLDLGQEEEGKSFEGEVAPHSWTQGGTLGVGGGPAPPLFAAPFPCVFFLCSCIPARITGTVVINAESMAVPEILLGI